MIWWYISCKCWQTFRSLKGFIIYKLIQKGGNMYAKITILKNAISEGCSKHEIQKGDYFKIQFVLCLYDLVDYTALYIVAQIGILFASLWISAEDTQVQLCRTILFYKWSLWYLKKILSSIFVLIKRKCFSSFLLTLPRFYDCTHETNQFKRYFIVS